jgi:hypothetical protein
VLFHCFAGCAKRDHGRVAGFAAQPKIRARDVVDAVPAAI